MEDRHGVRKMSGHLEGSYNFQGTFSGFPGGDNLHLTFNANKSSCRGNCSAGNRHYNLTGTLNATNFSIQLTSNQYPAVSLTGFVVVSNKPIMQVTRWESNDSNGMGCLICSTEPMSVPAANPSPSYNCQPSYSSPPQPSYASPPQPSYVSPSQPSYAMPAHPPPTTFPPSPQNFVHSSNVTITKVANGHRVQQTGLPGPAAVRMSAPIRVQPGSNKNGHIYFEIKYLSHGGIVGLGFVDSSFPLNGKMVGWEPGSIGFHSDDGKLFKETGMSTSSFLGRPWEPGATVGCGINLRTGHVFYTYKGEKVETTKKELKGEFYFCLSFDTMGAAVEVPTTPSTISPEIYGPEFIPVSVLICNESDCKLIRFPFCETHGLLFSSMRSDGRGQCPKAGCTNCAPVTSECPRCDENSMQSRFMNFYEHEVMFAANAILKEQSNVVHVRSFICPSCSTLEFPGMQGELLTAEDELKMQFAALFTPAGNALREAVLAATRKNFHHTHACEAEVQQQLFALAKLEVISLAVRFDQTKTLLQEDNGVSASPVATVGVIETSFSGPSRVRKVSSRDEIQSLCNSFNHRTVVVRASASWCPNCTRTWPSYCELSNSFQEGVAFIEVDTETVKPLPDMLRQGGDDSNQQMLPRFYVVHEGTLKRVVREPVQLHSYLLTIFPAPHPNQICPSGPSVIQRLHILEDEAMKVADAFRKSLTHQWSGIKLDIVAVSRVHNKQLENNFYQKKSDFQKKYPNQWEYVKTVEAYHGTCAQNAVGIAENGMDPSKIGENDKDSGTDGQGFFGNGFYFSEHADYTLLYNAHGNGIAQPKVGDTCTVMVFDIILGKSKQLSSLNVGGKLSPGYDSHVSPKGFEYVLFDRNQCVPRHIITINVLEEVCPGPSGHYES